MTLLEMYNQDKMLINILAAFALAVFCLTIYFLMDTKKRKINIPQGSNFAKIGELPESKTEKIMSAGIPNVLLFDKRTKKHGLRYVELDSNRDYGRLWEYLGKQVYALRNNNDGKPLEVIETPEALTETPGLLYFALSNLEDIKNIAGDSEHQSDKAKITLLVVALCVALFLTFLSVQAKR